MLHTEDFRRERASPTSIHFQFRLKDAHAPNNVHVFFEGHDDLSFYMNFLLTFSSDKEIYPYICSNKRNVYETHGKVTNGDCQGITLFFVDKDLSDVLNESWERAQNIYVTDYYSIENYLVSEEMLYRIWMELFRFKQGFLEFENSYRAKFREELERFYKLTLPIAAWAIYLRRLGKRPNVNNIHFSRFFVLKADLTLEKSTEMQQDNETHFLEHVCGESTPAEYQTGIDTIKEELLKLSPKFYLRGKLELCFFVRFVNALLEHLKHNLSLDEGSVSTKTPLTEENAVEILGPRLRIPQSLASFLQENLSPSN